MAKRRIQPGGGFSDDLTASRASLLLLLIDRRRGDHGCRLRPVPCRPARQAANAGVPGGVPILHRRPPPPIPRCCCSTRSGIPTRSGLLAGWWTRRVAQGASWRARAAVLAQVEAAYGGPPYRGRGVGRESDYGGFRKPSAAGFSGHAVLRRTPAGVLSRRVHGADEAAAPGSSPDGLTGSGPCLQPHPVHARHLCAHRRISTVTAAAIW